MCRPFSCIVTKSQHVYTHPNPLEHSHTEIMNHYNLKESNKDPSFNCFVKIEARPKDSKSYSTIPVDEWEIIVDEDSIPQWYSDDRESYEAIIRKESQSWINKIKNTDWNNIDWNNYTAEQCGFFAQTIKETGFKYPVLSLEQRIATCKFASYDYAACILKGPFELGEKAIATSIVSSYYYAISIINKRFELGESIIKGSDYQYYYEKFFNIKL